MSNSFMSSLYSIAITCFSIGMFFISCNGQSATPKSVSVDNQSVLGDTVFEIDKTIRCIFKDSKGNFWFGSDTTGVYRYNGKYFTRFATKHGLSHPQVRSIQEDRNGNIYFSTGDGVCCYNGNTITKLSNIGPIEPSDIGNNNWSLSPEYLWFDAGNINGVSRFNGSLFDILHFPQLDIKEKQSEFSMPYNIYSIYIDSKGCVWFGTEGKGVCCYDGKAFTWLTDLALKNTAIRGICEDKNGTMWFGSSGLGVFTYDGKQLRNFTDDKGVNDIEFVKVFRDNVPIERPIINKEGTLMSLMQITNDDNGNLWFATYGTGLWRYNGKKLTNYTTKNGLPSNFLRAVYNTPDGEIWIGTTDAGVCKFNGETFEPL